MFYHRKKLGVGCIKLWVLLSAPRRSNQETYFDIFILWCKKAIQNHVLLEKLRVGCFQCGHFYPESYMIWKSYEWDVSNFDIFILRREEATRKPRSRGKGRRLSRMSAVGRNAMTSSNAMRWIGLKSVHVKNRGIQSHPAIPPAMEAVFGPRNKFFFKFTYWQ